MFRTASNKINNFLLTAMVFLAAVGWPGLSAGNDTDIYQVSTKQNCYVLIDNSASMDFGVYESNVDYGSMYDYLFDLNENYIEDTVMAPEDFYDDHYERNKIFLLVGKIGVTFTTVDGETVTFTGDAADPDYIWYVSDLIDTHTYVDSSGNLTKEDGYNPLIKVDGDGYILLSDSQYDESLSTYSQLPLDRNIKLTDIETMYDGSKVNNGFGGLMNAPGYYYSGYSYDFSYCPSDTPLGACTGKEDDSPLVESNADTGDDTDIYFFVTGNWVNMQTVYNLHYVTNNPVPTGASQDDPAWKYETIPISNTEWPELLKTAYYPSSDGSVEYTNNLAETTTAQKITHPKAAQIQLHFSHFDVQGNNNTDTFTKDYVGIYTGSGELVAQYDNDNISSVDGECDFWSDTIVDDTVEITLSSNNATTGTGYVIDKIKVTYIPDNYLMQNRLDVAKDALLYVLDEFYGKINWGYTTFQYTAGGLGNGATINSALNPNLTDDANRAAIVNHVDNTTIGGDGTPLGEALQDVFEDGYWGKRNELNNLTCRKNYVISVTDGFPSEDDSEWDRIANSTGIDSYLPFEDWDGDGWTMDPYQWASGDTPEDPIPENYYDDVGHWMYTHSWDTKEEVADPANSYFNVMTHHVAFGMDHPMLKDAADESGGLYVAAYNKTQLVAAFYSLALQMTEAVSFTSPVVSVDAANKIQNGDDLYLGLFLPQDNQPWFGNIKKYKLGDGSTDRPNLWMLYDGDNREAINAEGEFLDNTSAFWADDDDANDSDNYGSADVKEDGVGEVLTERVAANFAAGTYWERPIYTYSTTNDAMVAVDPDHITATDLNVGDDLTRDMVINFLHGYTYEVADETTHAPLAVRDWALGAIVHSRPVIVDYYDESDALSQRLIVVGSNDGMLHVFDEADGSELLAFVPEDLLPKLQQLPLSPHVDMVDGEIALYRRDGDPKYLIFGERRGGSAYWCLNISNKDPLAWTVAWGYSNSEIAQSWSTPVIAKLPVDIDTSTGQRVYKDVVILTGGYDSVEDSYPEPFNDVDNDGNPYSDDSSKKIDTGEWDKNDSDMDVNLNNSYDLYNLDMDGHGRGIYVFDIDDPDNAVTNSSLVQVLPFSVVYGASDSSTAPKWTRSAMKFCFPASPAALTLTESYLYMDGGAINEDTQSNVLKAIYAIDIYANVYKIRYDFEVTPPEDLEAGSYSVDAGWELTHVFSGNPGSDSTSGTFGLGEDTADQGRKVFYPPTLSLGGSCSYFDAANYYFNNIEFSGLDEMVTLFFGTGDREHPAYTLIRDRYYSVYDDSSVSGVDISTSTDVEISSVPYTEDNLMNLSENVLDDTSNLSDAAKEAIRVGLTDDVSWDNSGTLELEYDGTAVNYEDDTKGWYIVLEDQDSSVDHYGEKVLSSSDLFAGVIYFTTYQPSVSDPCNPQGNGFAYSMNYCDASAAYDLSNSTYASDDRYTMVENIYGIPSDFAIVTREGQQAAMSMMGGKIAGPKGGSNFEIKGPGYGLELYYWRESDSLEQ